MVAVEASFRKANPAGEGVQLVVGEVARDVGPEPSVSGHLRGVDEDRHPVTVPPGLAEARTLPATSMDTGASADG